MVRQLASLSLLLLAGACAEDIAAPGACPDFCPTTGIQVVDTVVVASIFRDSSYSGYVPTHQAESMQLTTGGAFESHGVVRFQSFSDSVYLDTATTDLRPVIAIDSFSVRLVYDARSDGTGDFEFVFHRLPASVDSTVSYADLESFFNDSIELGTAWVTSEETSDSIDAVLPGDALPISEEDSSVVAIGLSVRSVEPAFVTLPTINSDYQYLQITRFVQVDSADGELAARSDTTNAAFDTFVFTDPPAPAATALQVGGSPSIRSFLHVALPSYIVDSSDVIRATLLLVPAEPVVGAPGDTIRILAEGLAADIGPKSPIVQVAADSIDFFSGLASVGSSDTLRIDVTHIVAPWKNYPDLSRSLMLRAVLESGTLGEFRFNSSVSAVGTPALQVTYVPQSLVGS